MAKKILLWCMIICSVSACSSIKEDREECPCWSSIDFSQVDASVQSLYVWFFDDTGMLLCRDTLHPNEYGKNYDIELKRGRVFCYAWGNVLDNTILTDDGTSGPLLFKAEGKEADPLYFYSKTLDTFNERICDTVIMHKEYSNVDVVLISDFANTGELEAVVEGVSAGQYIDGRIIEQTGKINLQTLSCNSGSCSFAFNMSRQKSLEELKLKLFLKKDKQKQVLGDLPLGTWLHDAGYDMNAADLEDISIEINIALGIVTIKAEGWNHTDVVTIII